METLRARPSQLTRGLPDKGLINRREPVVRLWHCWVRPRGAVIPGLLSPVSVSGFFLLHFSHGPSFSVHRRHRCTEFAEGHDCHLFFKIVSILFIDHLKFFIYLFWPWHVACWILVPQPGFELTLPAVEVQGLNNWTARKSQLWVSLKIGLKSRVRYPNQYLQI